MKYLLVSDIHGSSDSAKRIIGIFENENIDYILCLGDILYHGPRNDLPTNYAPKEVIKLLNPYAKKIIAVKGNCEAYVDQMVLDFKIYNKKSMNLFGKKVLLTHGHIINQDNFPKNKYDYIFMGHTHIHGIQEVLGTKFVNPGSITIPKNNQPRSYAILTEEEIVIKDIFNNVLLREKY